MGVCRKIKIKQIRVESMFSCWIEKKDIPVMPGTMIAPVGINRIGRDVAVALASKAVGTLFHLCCTSPLSQFVNVKNSARSGKRRAYLENQRPRNARPARRCTEHLVCLRPRCRCLHHRMNIVHSGMHGTRPMDEIENKSMLWTTRVRQAPGGID